jgi:hypothetical protein
VVRQYLAGLQQPDSRGAPRAGAGLAVALNFLLRLGLQAGRPMRYRQLAVSERTIAAHMAQLGLVMPVAANDDIWLHPTRFAAVLADPGFWTGSLQKTFHDHDA